MNQVAIRNEPPRSVLMDMSKRYGMMPEAFEATVRATCMRPDKQGRIPTREEFAAFLLVAKEYGLNPITKEIYAFSAKGGGIVPIVSIDGWVNLVNSHGACDGFEFEMEHDEDGKLVSCTCRMYRKDRSHPVSVTEYLSECVRHTEPWAMKHRMLRHKAMIQAARYAFGFAGIYDEDDGRTIAEAVDIMPKDRPRVPSPTEMIEGPENDAVTQSTEETEVEVITEPNQPKSNAPDITKEYDGWFSYILDRITHADDGGALESFWNAEVETKRKMIFPSDLTDLANAYGKAIERLNADGQ